jgi:hypothetical protein
MTITDPSRPASHPSAVEHFPGIGVGAVSEPIPWVETSRLSRYRMRTDRAGLHLQAGEIVLCAPYEPAALNMVVLVRCEADGYSPGVLISTSEVSYIGPAAEPLVMTLWDKPGKR